MSHLNRQDIANAAADPRPYQDHLDHCDDCRIQVELYRLAHAPEPIIDAPAQAVAAVAGLAQGRERFSVGRLLAQLTFDSWAELAPSGVRSLGPDRERRLRFEAESIRFDLRAEKVGATWRLAAQVKDLSGVDRPFRILSGRVKLSRRPDSFYIWTASRPPKQLTLVSGDTTVVLPEIVWNDPLKN